MIRILLADDQATVRGALAALLRLEKDMEVVAEVGRADEVLAAALQQKPDVALLGIEIPAVTASPPLPRCGTSSLPVGC